MEQEIDRLCSIGGLSMLGKYYVDIGNKYKQFHIEIEHRINVIKGNSASGKTTLIKFTVQFLRSGKSSGIKCDTNADNLVVLDKGDDYENIINRFRGSNTILFADEQVDFIKSKDFIRVLDDSGLYIVIISRRRVKYFDYSIKALYNIVTESRGKCSYSYLNRLYTGDGFTVQPDIMITEDSNSGFEAMNNMLKCKVISAHGKDNVVSKLDEIVAVNRVICIFVDGDAFGRNIESVISWSELYKNKRKLCIFIPDSFEWLLLKICNAYSRELSETYNFANTLEYKSWERYYVDLLNRYLDENNIHYFYDKGKLGDVWKLFGSKEKMFTDISKFFEHISSEYKNY